MFQYLENAHAHTEETQRDISAPLTEKLDLPPNVPLTKAQMHSWEHTLALFSLLPPLKTHINTQCKHQG